MWIQTRVGGQVFPTLSDGLRPEQGIVTKSSVCVGMCACMCVCVCVRVSGDATRDLRKRRGRKKQHPSRKVGGRKIWEKP